MVLFSVYIYECVCVYMHVHACVCVYIIGGHTHTHFIGKTSFLLYKLYIMKLFYIELGRIKFRPLVVN